MANWVRDFLECNPELARLPVVRRGRYSLHFCDGGQEVAFFMGTPCHWLNGREWIPLDTNLVWDARHNSWGAPGIATVIDSDGGVAVGGYGQRTGRVGLFEPATGKFTALAVFNGGGASGDSFIREARGYRHVITLKEDGLQETLVLLEKPPLGDKAETLLATEMLARGKEGLYFRPPVAWDARGNAAPVLRYVYGGRLYTGLPSWWLDKAIYPVTLDPDYAGHTGDGYIRGRDATYSIARSTAEAYTTAANILVGQLISAGNYNVYRGFLKFDTSDIPDGASAAQVNLGLTATYDNSTTDFDVQIIKQDWSGQDPLSADNMDTAFDNCLSGTADDNIWRNTSGISTNTCYWSGNLSTSWPNKTGYTYYSLRSDRDKSETTPLGSEYLAFYSQDATTESYRPLLRVYLEFASAVAGGWGGNGAVNKRAATVKAGALSSGGVLAKCASKFFSGAWSGEGVLGKLKVRLISLAGAWSSVGDLTRISYKIFSGDWDGAGALGYVKPFLKSIAGITGFRGVIRHKRWWRRLCAWLRLD